MARKIINDGSVVADSRTLTIDGVVYATDDFTLTQEKSEIVRTSSVGVPTGMKTIPGLTRGTATLQLATSSTALPGNGATFTEDSVVYVVQVTNRGETKGSETKIPIEFYARITTDLVLTTV